MQPANTINNVASDPMDDSVATATRYLPLSISISVLFVVGCLAFLVLNFVFPVFVIADELLAPTPPEAVAVAREKAFARARLTNSLLAFSVISFIVATAWPTGLVLMKRLPKHAMRYLIPTALGSAFIACLGVVFGHLVMELTTSFTMGMTRTFLAHWLVFSFFGLAIGMAIGVAIGDRKITSEACQRGFVTGLISATVFDLISVVIPKAQVDTLFPGGVLWGGRDAMIVAAWVGLLLMPLAFALRKLGNSPAKS